MLWSRSADTFPRLPSLLLAYDLGVVFDAAALLAPWTLLFLGSCGRLLPPGAPRSSRCQPTCLAHSAFDRNLSLAAVDVAAR